MGVARSSTTTHPLKPSEPANNQANRFIALFLWRVLLRDLDDDVVDARWRVLVDDELAEHESVQPLVLEHPAAHGSECSDEDCEC